MAKNIESSPDKNVEKRNPETKKEATQRVVKETKTNLDKLKSDVQKNRK